MAVQIFRRALHREIDAERKRLLVDRAREGVVDDRRDAPRLARRRDPPDVDAPQRRVDRRLEPHDARPIGQDPFRLGQRLERHEPRLDAEPREKVVQQVQRAAIDRRPADDLVARAHVRHEERRRRPHPRGEQERRFGPIEHRQLLLDARDRWIGVPRVEILRRSAFVVGHDFFRALEDERRRLVDRRRQGRGDADAGLAGVNEVGGKASWHVLILEKRGSRPAGRRRRARRWPRPPAR